MINETEFRDVFAPYKEKRIILYGTGRRTLELLSLKLDFHFVALMDKNPDLVGQKIYGLSVVNLHEAEQIADIIIINSSETFWNTIYKRIVHSRIPVYFRNGDIATIKEPDGKQNIFYWKQNMHHMQKIVYLYDVVSFDMFDTLVTRKVVSPEDIFEIIQREKKNNFIEWRYQAIRELENENYSLDELYRKEEKINGLKKYSLEELKKYEIETERALIFPRKTMIDFFNQLCEMGKDIYIISDMYLPAQILKEILDDCGLNINIERILVSSEIKTSKKDLGLWKYYQEHYIKGRSAIHIGDNYQTDVINPRKFGIHSYYVMSTVEMLRCSSAFEAYDSICTLEDSIKVGSAISEKFNDPFALGITQGIVNGNIFE